MKYLGNMYVIGSRLKHRHMLKESIAFLLKYGVCDNIGSALGSVGFRGLKLNKGKQRSRIANGLERRLCDFLHM